MATSYYQPEKWVSYIPACKVIGVRRKLLRGSRLLKRKTLFSSSDGRDRFQPSAKEGWIPNNLLGIFKKRKFPKKVKITLTPVRLKETNATTQWTTCTRNVAPDSPGEDIISEGVLTKKCRVELADCKQPQVNSTPKTSTEDSTQGAGKKERIDCFENSVKKPQGYTTHDKVQEDCSNSPKKVGALFEPSVMEPDGVQSSVESRTTLTNGVMEVKQLPLKYQNQIDNLKISLKEMHRKQRKEKTDSRLMAGSDIPDRGEAKSLSLTLRPLTTPNGRHRASRSLIEGSRFVENSCNKKVKEAVNLPMLSSKLNNGALVAPTSENGDRDEDGDYSLSSDDDVIIESIQTPRALTRKQITSCISDLLDSSKTPEAPTLEFVRQKLKSIFGEKIMPWKHDIEEQYKILKSSPSVPSLLPMQQDQGLVTVGKYSITEADLSSLEEDAWLNDNIINAYFQLIADESPMEVFALSSFFYQVYSRKGFTHVQRWHKKIDLYAHQIILIPIHSRHHWCLVAVNVDEDTITFYDSIRKSGSSYLTKIKRFMKEEADAKGTEQREWKLKSSDRIPQQRNYSDCGVFVCQFAKRLSFGKHVIFSHREAADFRRVMKRELLAKHLEKEVPRYSRFGRF